MQPRAPGLLSQCRASSVPLPHHGRADTLGTASPLGPWSVASVPMRHRNISAHLFIARAGKHQQRRPGLTVESCREATVPGRCCRKDFRRRGRMPDLAGDAPVFVGLRSPRSSGGPALSGRRLLPLTFRPLGRRRLLAPVVSR